MKDLENNDQRFIDLELDNLKLIIIVTDKNTSLKQASDICIEKLTEYSKI